MWLTGVDKCFSTTNALVRKVVTANPRVKVVILAASQKPEDVVAALSAGACGFLCQDIAGETLLRSMELIAHGEMIVHPQFASDRPAAGDAQSAGDAADTAAYVTTNGNATTPSALSAAISSHRVDVEAANENQTERCPVSVSS